MGLLPEQHDAGTHLWCKMQTLVEAWKAREDENIEYINLLTSVSIEMYEICKLYHEELLNQGVEADCPEMQMLKKFEELFIDAESVEQPEG